MLNDVSGVRWLRRAHYSAIPILLLANFFAFRAFGIDYIKWYLDNGAMFSSAILLGALTLEKLAGSHDLISRNAADFFRAHVYAIGSIFETFGRHLFEVFEAGKPSKKSERSHWDSFAILVVALLLPPFILAYLLIVTPANYVVTLIAGAPSREFRRLGEKPAQPTSGFELASKPLAMTQALAALLLFGLGKALN